MSRKLSAAKAICCDDLALAAERLRDIGSQDALALLRSSFGAPKVLHLLRCDAHIVAFIIIITN